MPSTLRCQARPRPFNVARSGATFDRDKLGSNSIHSEFSYRLRRHRDGVATRANGNMDAVCVAAAVHDPGTAKMLPNLLGVHPGAANLSIAQHSAAKLTLRYYSTRNQLC
jgi:hypothetical protein